MRNSDARSASARGFDGCTPTLAAEGRSSDCLRKPVAIYPDPARTDGAGHVRRSRFPTSSFRISILNSVNDLLDDMFALGIVALFTALDDSQAGNRSQGASALLKRLQAELERAKREVKEASAQLVIDVALTGYCGLLRSAGLACRWVPSAVAHLAADVYLGPSTSDAATWGARGNTTLGTAASASKNYMEATSKVVRVAKPAGRIHPRGWLCLRRQ